MYAPDFMHAVPYEHINRGPFAGPPQQLLAIQLAWPGIRNAGDVGGFVALRFTLEEHRGFGFPNIEWATFTPLTNEGGPRFIKDKIFEDTSGAHFIDGGIPNINVAPGQTVTLFDSILVPGVAQGTAMQDFWNNEGNVEFNIHMWLFEVTSGNVLIPHGGDRQSIAYHKFDPAFQLV